MANNTDSILERFLDKRGYDALYSALSNYIEDNPDNLDLLYGSNFVEEPDGARLDDMDIIRTVNVDIDGDSISFDAIVSAEIEIEETVRRNRETDNVRQWFNMKCEVDVTDTPGLLKVHKVSVYSR